MTGVAQTSNRSLQEPLDDLCIDWRPVKLLWHGSWMQTPGYHVSDVAVLIEVSMAVPLVALGNASERVTRRPYRKVMTLLLTDGPRRTSRKVRSKRGEARLTGDYRVTLILGRVLATKQPALALGSRVPPAAQQIPVHRNLVREVPDGFDATDLCRVASFLTGERRVLSRLSRQSFLYSGSEPPSELVDLLDDAIGQARREERFGSCAAIEAPASTGTKADAAIRIAEPPPNSSIPVALLGAGDYARTEIIPELRGEELALHSVADREPQIAAMIAREHGFAVAATDCERAIAHLPRSGLVVVATAHDSHAALAEAAAKAGHSVFVEKPPTVTADDVVRLVDVMKEKPGAVEIGFNRRYHPLVRRARERLRAESGPTSIVCTIKEIELEPDHWYLWPNQGTRITGNLCHWIDLAVFLIGSNVMPASVSLSPQTSGSRHAMDGERALTVTFENGSLLVILATERGDDIRGVQEQIDVRKGRTSIMIDDLWRMRVRSGGVDRRSRTPFRHKGHADMYRTALRRLLRGEPAAYPPADMVVVSAIQITASALATTGELRGEIPSWLEPTLQKLA